MSDTELLLIGFDVLGIFFFGGAEVTIRANDGVWFKSLF